MGLLLKNAKFVDPAGGTVTPLDLLIEGERIAADVERRSLETLVRPYEELRALTPREILSLLKNVKAQEDTACDDVFYGAFDSLDASDYAVPDPAGGNDCDEPEAETAEQDTRPDWLKTWAG